MVRWRKLLLSNAANPIPQSERQGGTKVAFVRRPDVVEPEGSHDRTRKRAQSVQPRVCPREISAGRSVDPRDPRHWRRQHLTCRSGRDSAAARGFSGPDLWSHAHWRTLGLESTLFAGQRKVL